MAVTNHAYLFDSYRHCVQEIQLLSWTAVASIFLGYDESHSDWYSKESVGYKIVKVCLLLDHQLFVVFLSIEF